MSEAVAAPSPASPSPPSPSPVDRVREFFTLHALERDVRALPEGPRTTAQRDLALAFQKRDAAETLWPRGSCSEALKLARTAVDAAASALESFASAVDARHEWVARAQALASAAREQIAGRALPELESDARPEDEATFRLLVDASIAIERAVGPHLASAREIAQLRRARIATAAVSLVALIALLAWILHEPDFRSAAASGQGPTETADKAIDGSSATNWALPTKQTGWLELTLPKPRRVRALHMVSYNPPWNDRAVKDAHVTCYSGSDSKAIDFTFPPPPPQGADVVWTDVPFDAPKCDRIRFDVSTYYGQSPAIAEVEIK